jgi:hypothetical protein
MRGQAGMQHLISIHFSWPLLGRSLMQRGREGMLYFVFNSNVVAVMVAHNLDTGEFVAQAGDMMLWLCGSVHTVWGSGRPECVSKSKSRSAS